MDFERGELYIQCLNGVEASLFMPEEDTAEPYAYVPIKEIVCMAEGLFSCGSLESAREIYHEGQVIPSTGLTISFRKATEVDLFLILSEFCMHEERWDLCSWAVSLRGVPELDPEWRDHILRFLYVYLDKGIVGLLTVSLV